MKKMLIIISVVVIAAGLVGGSYLLIKNTLPQTSAVSTENKLPLLDKKVTVSPTPVITVENKTISLTVNPLSTSTTSKITVTGKTVPNAEVSVNEADVKADKLGNFSALVVLEIGDNNILVMATDEDGNYASKELMVTYIP